MTAERQERKSRRDIARVLAGAAVGLLAGLPAVRLYAATTDPVVSNRHTGLAIDGFDPVAYFVDGAPKPGRAGLELPLHGAIWRFCNEGNRAAFAANPAAYAPRFGGHDPVAAARGAATPGHPELWLIAQGGLYLFYSAEARAAFARDPGGAIEAAERHWPEVLKNLSP